ncbi:hypothetical protein [Paenibacillus xylanexedens]|uniref:hypothetical protein n=1 Tax=Paenibacillus xylanexedens TaxID=528191 RepID=UPI000F9A3067|nr:hypothetical protein [Paenibacillus xylanexedens]RPK31796.1 hypothetical protein EDO6_02423 [Paenibacillus xylanexedens]
MNWFKNIPVVKWDDLDGKTLLMRIEESEGVKIIAGYDPADNKMYVLAEEFNKGE